ncbi:hypothetical protein [Marininema halotolerans]|uniref:Uncharacterized protein n=1 Tax=Marininema halotolerans TaxID=1155944 RepID=A0A1I6T8S3_9BACL|nr:hypothetical protein [Marininema halotolerans]SFS85625.1 hypothetical protein SAMN05444972_10993 [Marininema halotolerans]
MNFDSYSLEHHIRSRQEEADECCQQPKLDRPSLFYRIGQRLGLTEATLAKPEPPHLKPLKLTEQPSSNLVFLQLYRNRTRQPKGRRAQRRSS